MINPSHLKTFVIRPVLDTLGLGGVTAENLVLGTIIHESTVKNDTCLRQITNSGYGPAYGCGMMEDATTKDLFGRFLELPKNTRLKAVVQRYVLPGDLTTQFPGNLYLMVVAIRLRYYMSPKALPSNNAQALCEMWKDVYNTSLGKGRVDAPTVACLTKAMGA